MLKVMCNNPSCKFCCIHEDRYNNHCTQDDAIDLDWHWIDTDQCLLFCTSFELKEDKENG